MVIDSICCMSADMTLTEVNAGFMRKSSMYNQESYSWFKKRTMVKTNFYDLMLAVLLVKRSLTHKK